MPNGDASEVVLVVSGHQRGDDFKVEMTRPDDPSFRPMGCVWCDGECKCGNPTPVCPDHGREFQKRFEFQIRVTVDADTGEIQVDLGSHTC